MDKQKEMLITTFFLYLVLHIDGLIVEHAYFFKQLPNKIFMAAVDGVVQWRGSTLQLKEKKENQNDGMHAEIAIIVSLT